MTRSTSFAPTVLLVGAAMLACGGAPAPPGAAAPVPVAAPEEAAEDPDGDDRYGHAGFHVRVVVVEQAGASDEEERRADLQIQFTWGVDSKLTATLDSGAHIGCETSEASVGPVPELNDPRLAILDFLCDQGEDILSRSVVTALLFIGDADDQPAVLWEGTGTFHSDFGLCNAMEIPYFRRNIRGQVEAVRWSEVERVEGDNVEAAADCKPVPRKDTVLGIVAIPAA